ncbi:Glyoxal reductase [Clostridiales bacterium CHKCI006]|nr:Glyoxal reductase [Clostridiales bacterium CHKCI006]
MILHHPVNHYLYAYGMLEKAYQEGKLKAIGLSNFPVDKIQEILDHCKIPPMVMQVEGHPYYPAEACHEFCDAHDIKLQCWFPLGHGSQELLNDPVVVELAKAHDRTPAQIVLRWHVQMGFTPMPGSRSEGHIAENAKIFDFSLTEEEMQKMAGINRHTPFYKVTPESLARLATTKCNFEE